MTFLAAAVATLGAVPALAAQCARTITARVVALDQPLMFNRLGAQNVNGIVYALERDVVDKTTGLTLSAATSGTPGNVALLPDKRPRPLVPPGTTDPIGAIIEIFSDEEVLTGTLPDRPAR